MSALPSRWHLPIQLTDGPTEWGHWLRDAGVPVVQSVSADSFEPHELNDFLLYDSRSNTSRVAAAAARKTGQLPIDLAAVMNESPTVSSTSASPWHNRNERTTRGEVLGRLKMKLEQVGGVWARIADVPYPWKSVRLGGEFPREFTEAPWSTLFAKRRANFEAAHLTNECPWVPRSHAVHRSGQLIWTTDGVRFLDWWTVRRQWQVRIRREPDRFRLVCQGPETEFRPYLELWRGNHVAMVPLANGRFTVSQAGLVFEHEWNGDPIGITTVLPARFPAIPVSLPESA